MRCPICRAEVERAPQCRRCRADLTLLWKLDEQRRQVLQAAYACTLRGQLKRARILAEGVDALRHDEEGRRLLALGRLLERDFAGAWAEYISLQHPPGSSNHTEASTS